MKKITLLIILGLIIQTVVSSQNCLPDGIVFSNQLRIDNFQTDYPNCTEILGNVDIGFFSTSDITNLSGLDVITSIGGNLTIKDNPLLYNLTGLDSLNSIGEDLYIMDNDNLYSLTGLNNLNSIGERLVLWSNNELNNIWALMNLKTIGSDLKVYYNSSLGSLSGLNNLIFIGGDFKISEDHITSLEVLSKLNTIGGGLEIRGCWHLTNLKGLENITSIGNNLSVISNSRITNLEGLNNTTTIGGDFEVYGNNILLSLEGLEKLNFIGGNFSLGINDYEGPIGNPSLKSIYSLTNLNTINGWIWVLGNDSLSSLSGIDNINAGTIDYIEVYDNPQLTECGITSICDYLKNQNSILYIGNNSTHCNNREEILETCDTLSVYETDASHNLTVYPNPTLEKIHITHLNNEKIQEVTILNQYGTIVLNQNKGNDLIDVSTLNGGLYIIEIVISSNKYRDKLLIK